MQEGDDNQEKGDDSRRDDSGRRNSGNFDNENEGNSPENNTDNQEQMDVDTGSTSSTESFLEMIAE